MSIGSDESTNDDDNESGSGKTQSRIISSQKPEDEMVQRLADLSDSNFRSKPTTVAHDGSKLANRQSRITNRTITAMTSLVAKVK